MSTGVAILKAKAALLALALFWGVSVAKLTVFDRWLDSHHPQVTRTICHGQQGTIVKWKTEPAVCVTSSKSYIGSLSFTPSK